MCVCDIFLYLHTSSSESHSDTRNISTDKTVSGFGCNFYCLSKDVQTWVLAIFGSVSKGGKFAFTRSCDFAHNKEFKLKKKKVWSSPDITCTTFYVYVSSADRLHCFFVLFAHTLCDKKNLYKCKHRWFVYTQLFYYYYSLKRSSKTGAWLFNLYFRPHIYAVEQ